MSQLPLGWAYSTIGEVTVYISRGKSPKYTAKSSLPVVNQKAIRWFGIQEEHLKYIHPDQFREWTEERFIKEDDILWNSTGTGTIGRACLVFHQHLNPPKVVDSHVTIVRPNKEIVDPRYLFAWIRSPRIQGKIEGLATGTTNQIELSRAAVSGAEIPLAPIKEQKRIADKLDSLFARVQACRECLDRVPGILKQFRQAVLSAATSGELTAEWRQVRGTSKKWKSVRLAEVAVARLGKMLDRAKNVGQPTPYLRNINVRWFNFDLSDIQKIKVTRQEARDLSIESGDVLVCEGGEPGRCAIWRGNKTNYVYQKALHRVRVSPNLLPEWLCYSLKEAADSGRLADLFTGTTIKHLTGVALAKFQFRLPPLEEQREIIRRVEVLLQYAERLNQRYTIAREHVERLTAAILVKAFRGELVPQDSSDEPASILLERILYAKSVEFPKAKKTQVKFLKGARPEEVSMLKKNEVGQRHLSTILREHGALTAEELWSASQLGIDDFYDQLKDEEGLGFLKEKRDKSPTVSRLLEAVA